MPSMMAACLTVIQRSLNSRVDIMYFNIDQGHIMILQCLSPY